VTVKAGGDGVLLDNAGTDATSEFQAVGHSDEVMETFEAISYLKNHPKLL
jgi:cytochrome b involved in lipid metabolism